ncbi:MAG: hypothetical protein ABSC94_22760, partial [Polyangiaceae bacterium]
SVVNRDLLRRGPTLDELSYLSLDLSPTPEARLKVYARHVHCTAADLEAAASGSASHQPGDVLDFVQIMEPTNRHVFDHRIPSTCYTFVSGSEVRPVAATTHLPVNAYAPDDRAIKLRTERCLRRFGIPTDSYARCVESFANRPLDNEIGLHSYVSYRRHREERRITAYLAVEAYTPGMVEDPSSFPTSTLIELESARPSVCDAPRRPTPAEVASRASGGDSG